MCAISMLKMSMGAETNSTHPPSHGWEKTYSDDYGAGSKGQPFTADMNRRELVGNVNKGSAAGFDLR